MNTFKVAVTGTHSTGKTTFVEMLREKLESNGYTVGVVSDLGEECLNLGFRILYDHTPQSTLWIMSRGISLELEAALRANVILVDRPVPDALAYYRAALSYRDEASQERWADYLAVPAGHHATTYDMIFNTRLDPTIPLGTNKPRDPDGKFRALADEAASDVLTELGVTAHALTPDNHAEAAEFVLQQVQAHFSTVAKSLIPTQTKADELTLASE